MPYNNISLQDRLRTDSAGTPMASFVAQFVERTFVSSDGTNYYDPRQNAVYINANSSSPLADFIHEFAHSLTAAEHAAALGAIDSISDSAAMLAALTAEIRYNEARADAFSIFYLGQANLLNSLGLGSGYIGVGAAINLYNDCKNQTGFVPNTSTGAVAMMGCLVAGVSQQMSDQAVQTTEYSEFVANWRSMRGMSTTPPSPSPAPGSGGDSSGLAPPMPSPAPVNPLPPAPPIREVNVTDPAPVPSPPPPGGGGGGGGPKPGDDDLQPMRVTPNGDAHDAERLPTARSGGLPMTAPPLPRSVFVEAGQLVGAMAAFGAVPGTGLAAIQPEFRVPLQLVSNAVG